MVNKNMENKPGSERNHYFSGNAGEMKGGMNEMEEKEYGLRYVPGNLARLVKDNFSWRKTINAARNVTLAGAALAGLTYCMVQRDIEEKKEWTQFIGDTLADVYTLPVKEAGNVVYRDFAAIDHDGDDRYDIFVQKGGRKFEPGDRSFYQIEKLIGFERRKQEN